jgi:voltage-dependent calcium channel P/Q type alpha-1A
LVTSKYFDGFIIALIAIYSVLLGMKDYTDLKNKTSVNKLLHDIDPYFNVIIYMEFLLKIIAMGFAFGKGTYMSDSWNWIDFVVVVSSLGETLISVVS